MRLSRSAFLILLPLLGCDNIDWGGAEIAVVPPPPRADVREETAARPGEERLPKGPVLYYVRASGGGGTMIPVGEITGDSLRPLKAVKDWSVFGNRFIAEHLRQDNEFALFKGDLRAGTFVVQSARLEEQACHPIPQATGVLELTAGAEAAAEFLALSKAHSPAFRRPRLVSLEPNRTMQIVGPILAERLLRARQAQLPGNWLRAMAQLKPFPLAGYRDPAFASTFLVDDTLGPGFDNQGYSLFFVALPQSQTGYDTAFAVFTDYPTQGKAARRVVDFLDWDRDDEAELLLQVYGLHETWFEAVGSRDGRWSYIFQDRCTRALTEPPPDTLTRDSAAADTAAAGTRPPTGGASPELLGRPARRPPPRPARRDTAPRDTSG